MADGAGDQAEVVRDIVARPGSCVVTSSDPDDLAFALADELDGELIEAAELGEALARRLQVLDARTDALAALEAHARLHADAAGHRHVVSDLATLRRLVERIDQANRFVEESRARLRERTSAGRDLAVHPESIRKAAAEVIEARAAQQAAETEIAELKAATPPADDAEAPAAAEARDPGQRQAVVRAAIVVVVGLLAGVLATVALGSPVPLLLPLLAGGGGALILWRHREDVAGRDVAADNLAAVSALTDRAYGGVELAEPEAVVEARRRLTALEERLRYAESSWVSLVGPDVDVTDLDAVLAGRDAQWHVGDVELSRTPTLRAAEAYARRLRAQWRLAWWALDRPVPATDHAVAAVEELDRDGIDVITVPTWLARSPERAAAEAEFQRLAAGRAIEELRAAAAAAPAPLVVLDEEGEVREADLAARTALLPPDARVVVIGPESDGQTG